MGDIALMLILRIVFQKFILPIDWNYSEAFCLKRGVHALMTFAANFEHGAPRSRASERIEKAVNEGSNRFFLKK